MSVDRRTSHGPAIGAGRRPYPSTPATERLPRPSISWAFVFAGLLAGGALSFGAGVVTGTQMTAVAYRGALPNQPAADSSGPWNGGSAAPGRFNSNGPPDRQVAAAPAASARAEPGVASTAKMPGAEPRAAGEALVQLPMRSRWPAPARTEATLPRADASASERPRGHATPPPPLPKPEGAAPQRLTPMRAGDPIAPPGSDGAPAFAPARMPIWQVSVPVRDVGVGGGVDKRDRRQPFADGRGAAANRRTLAGGTAFVRLPPPVPPARAAAPGRNASDPPPTTAQPDGGYSVQVGAYRQRANALAQAARLLAAGYAPRIVHARATQSRLFMVRLGAFDARPTARAYARQLARTLDVDTFPVAN